MSAQAYLNSIYGYADQFKVGYKGAAAVELPDDYSEVSEVIIAGMGGSSFGGRILESAFEKNDLLIPVELLLSYDLPAYADESNLVILTSYSGNTEEVLSVLEQARSKGCKLLVISSGGKLGSAIDSDKLPGYVFDTKHNPSNSPRTGTGYIAGATLSIFNKLKFLDFDQQEADELTQYMTTFINLMKKDGKLAKQIAEKLLGRIPILVSSEHLDSATYIWRNFMNETAKSMGFMAEIPASNHHFLDGLQFPEDVRKKLLFVYIMSSKYHPQNKKRMKVMRQATKDRGLSDISITLGSGKPLHEIWELIIIGSLVSYNLALANKVDPATNEMVDYLKAHL